MVQLKNIKERLQCLRLGEKYGDTRVRVLLRASERTNLENAFGECYKQLCKGQKEDVDPLLTAILAGKETE